MRRQASEPISPTTKCPKCSFDVRLETAEKAAAADGGLGYKCPTPGCGAVLLGPIIVSPPPVATQPNASTVLAQPATAPSISIPVAGLTPPAQPTRLSHRSPAELVETVFGSTPVPVKRGDGSYRIAIGPVKYSPIRYHTFDVGPVEVSFKPAEGEAFKDAVARAVGELDQSYRLAFRQARLLFVGSFETLFGPGSYERSLGGDAVLTTDKPAPR